MTTATASPSFLTNLERACPRALDHYEARIPRDVRHTGVGVAAHEVLHALAEGRPVQGIVDRLVSEGRWGEAPMPPALAEEGRALAIRWVERYPLAPGGLYEVGLAFDGRWTSVPWKDSSAVFRLRLDAKRIDTVEDEDGGAWRVAVATDYKTSWQDGPDALDSLQMQAQAVALWLTEPDVAAVRIEVANLRRQQIYERTIWLDDEGLTLLRSWRDRIDNLVSVSRITPRKASPGLGCLRCYYIEACKDARAFLEATNTGTAEDVTRRWLVAKRLASAYEAQVKAIVADGTNVELDGGFVGLVEAPTKEPLPGSAADAAVAYLTRALGSVDAGIADAVRGLFASAGEPSVTYLTALVRGLWPSRAKADTEARKEWLAAHTETRMQPRLKAVLAGDREPDEAD